MLSQNSNFNKFGITDEGFNEFSADKKISNFKYFSNKINDLEEERFRTDATKKKKRCCKPISF